MFFGKKNTVTGARGEPMPPENYGPPDSERRVAGAKRSLPRKD
jgi:hypothetical protein